MNWIKQLYYGFVKSNQKLDAGLIGNSKEFTCQIIS